MLLVCKSKLCLYSWDYVGKAVYPVWVTCPKCYNKLQLKKSEVKV